MYFIDKLLDEDYDWGNERIDEDVYDELLLYWRMATDFSTEDLQPHNKPFG